MEKNEFPQGDVDVLVGLAADLERIELIKDPADLNTQDAIDNFRTVLNFAKDPETPESARAQIQRHVIDVKRRVDDLLSTLSRRGLVPAREAA
jgi:hypothetical protein